jgi:hypothetical protein
MAEKEYRKLAGRGRRKGELFAWQTLWLGRDHILQVEHTGYSEDYKRFYFGDIQSIVITKTDRARVWSFVLAGLLVVGLVLGVTLGVGNAVWLYLSLGIIALTILFLSINLIKGPSCTCFVQTAVQREQLASLRRVKKARRVMTGLRELIGSTQGLLAPEEARARFAAGEHAGVSSAREIPAQQPPPGGPVETLSPPPTA